MVGIELPAEDQLPAGPSRDLVVALHELYSGAGRPGLRSIATAIRRGDFRDTVSHEAISDMLKGKGVPRFSKLECVVLQLAAWNTARPDPGETATRFLHLWRAATGDHLGSIPPPAAIRSDPAGRPSVQPDTYEQSAPRSEAQETPNAFAREAPRLATFQPADSRPEDSRSFRDEWTQSRTDLIKGQARWSEPSNDNQTANVRHLRENQSSHPAIAERSSRPDGPPSIRVGIRVACTPLGSKLPTSSVIRASFLNFLNRKPITRLIDDMNNPYLPIKWEKWGGHGRWNHEAILLTGEGQRTPPVVAWTRLLLPERPIQAGWRDAHSALFLLHIERQHWQTDNMAPAIPFLDWHPILTRALDCPIAFVSFLAQDLGLNIPKRDPAAPPDIITEYTAGLSLGEPAASICVWLSTPQALTELVDIKGFQRLPGSPISPHFTALAVTDAKGAEAGGMAVDWMRQMSDDALHLDDYDSSLSGLW